MKAARLVVLGIAVAAGGLAAFIAGTFDSTPPPPQIVGIPTVEVLVAKNDIGMGTALGPQDLEWATWPETAAQNPAYIRKRDRPEAQQQLTGAIVRISMSQGEPVREHKLIRGKNAGYMAAILPAGMRAYSTEISPESGAGGFILPNDRVDVILTPKRGRDDDRASSKRIETYTSDTILTDVRVLAIDQLVQEKAGERVVIGKVATLELTQRQAELLAAARQAGVLTVTLRSIVDAGVKQEVADDKGANRFNTIRFGVSTSTFSR